MRQLVIDIETIPNLAWSWELYKAFISPDQIVEPSRMICFAAKWLDSDEVEWWSEWNNGHDVMVKQAWTLLDEADAVIHYNGEAFDVPRLNREFDHMELGPPSPYKQVDLLRTAKKRFGFPSNKLNYITGELGIGKKVEHQGWSLWLGCIQGDDESWQTMRLYNKQDVILTDGLYNRWLPWITSLPSFGAFEGKDICPACGSDALVRQGYRQTRTGRYQRYQCGVCRTWSAATRRESGTKIAQVPV